MQIYFITLNLKRKTVSLKNNLFFCTDHSKLSLFKKKCILSIFRVCKIKTNEKKEEYNWCHITLIPLNNHKNVKIISASSHQGIIGNVSVATTTGADLTQ